jgi:hypothetical protein
MQANRSKQPTLAVSMQLLLALPANTGASTAAPQAARLWPLHTTSIPPGYATPTSPTENAFEQKRHGVVYYCSSNHTGAGILHPAY